MRVKVPTEYEFLIHKYKIAFKPHLWHDDGEAGEANHRRGEINIDPNISQSEWVVTLNHEILEALKHHLSLKLEHDDLDRIAQGFADFMVTTLNIEFDWSDIPLSSQ